MTVRSARRVRDEFDVCPLEIGLRSPVSENSQAGSRVTASQREAHRQRTLAPIPVAIPPGHARFAPFGRGLRVTSHTK
jgi:hypothetical protein